jgi:hypothetical protein
MFSSASVLTHKQTHTQDTFINPMVELPDFPAFDSKESNDFSKPYHTHCKEVRGCFFLCLLFFFHTHALHAWTQTHTRTETHPPIGAQVCDAAAAVWCAGAVEQVLGVDCNAFPCVSLLRRWRTVRAILRQSALWCTQASPPGRRTKAHARHSHKGNQVVCKVPRDMDTG